MQPKHQCFSKLLSLVLAESKIVDMEQKDEKFSEYLFFEEDRPAHEVNITTRLTRALSQRNIERALNFTLKASSNNNVKKEDFLYVCLHGIPVLKKQFQALELPGQCVYYKFLPFSKKVLEQDDYTCIQEEVERLHQLIQNSSKSKPIVFVSHSFGEYTLATYIQRYPNDRVVGMISIGGPPVRVYPRIKYILQQGLMMGEENLKKNKEAVFAEFNKIRKKSADIFEVDYNEDNYFAFFLLSIKNEPFKNLFKLMRSWPKVLKCIIYGRDDHIMPEDYFSQKITHYCYQNCVEEHTEVRIKGKWKEVYGMECQNVQEQFVYNLEGGGHSVHIQRRFKEVLPKIVQQYLYFISTSSGAQSKL